MFAALAAGPREAGTPLASQSRQLLRRHLESLGFSVEEEPFEFSAQALWAVPLLGVGLGVLGLLEIPLLGSPEYPAWAAAALWITGLTLLGALGVRLVAGARLPWFPLLNDANLVATRGVGVVSCWLVAHTDTKAQGHSMAGRLIAVWVGLLAVAGLTLLTTWRHAGGRPLADGYVLCGVALAVLAGILAWRGRRQGGSPGARDNGSGILAILAATEAVPRIPLGVIFTGAEEFGLLGARHLARTRPHLFRDTDVVNLDTLADRGRTYVVTHHAADKPLARRLTEILTPLGTRVVQRRLPIGILVDSIPLARAARSAVTVSRLDWTVLRLMHTPRDTVDGLDPKFAEAVGQAIARAMGSFRRLH